MNCSLYSLEFDLKRCLLVESEFINASEAALEVQTSFNTMKNFIQGIATNLIKDFPMRLNCSCKCKQI